MKLLKLKFIKNTILTFIVFLFDFSYLGLEQKTLAWSSVSELEDRDNQISFFISWLDPSISSAK